MSIFLAGVANAEIFKGNDLFATAKTLIDSSITIGVSAEDIRAGQGAKLYGKYFHTSTFDLKMTDAMFRLEYIAANVGADLELSGDVFIEEQLNTEDGTFTLSNIPKPMEEGQPVYVYYKKSTDSYYTTAKVFEKNTQTSTSITIDNIDEGKYCVKYLYTNESARKLSVSANFTPDTLSIYLTANLYAGDANDPSTGTRVGTVTIKVPRFLLSGSQELSMSMTGASNTAFEGSALATKGEGCDGDGIYAEIIEVINNRTFNDFVDIVIEGQYEMLDLKKGSVFPLVIYGRYEDGGPVKIKNYDNMIIDVVQITPPNCTDFITISKNGEIVANDIGSGYIQAKVGNISSEKMEISVDCYYHEFFD